MLRKTAFLMCMVLALGVGATAYASVEEAEPAPCFNYIDYVSVSFDISGGAATASGLISPRGNLHTRISVKLQVLEDGVWKTRKIWNGSNTAGTCSAGGTHTLTSGYYYRVYVRGSVYDSNGAQLEVHNMTSKTKYY